MYLRPFRKISQKCVPLGHHLLRVRGAVVRGLHKVHNHGQVGARVDHNVIRQVVVADAQRREQLYGSAQVPVMCLA